MRVVVVFLLLSVWLAWPALAAACDSTGCSIVMRGQDGVGKDGVLRVDLSFRRFSMDKPLTRTHGGAVLVPWIDFARRTIRADYHAETPSDHTILAVDLSYGVTPRLTLTASLPFVRRSFGFRHAVATPSTTPTDPHGHAPFDPNAPVVEGRYDTSGLGDLQPGGRYALHIGPKSRLVAGVAARIPTGRYKASDAAIGIFHPAFQSGTGAWGAAGSLQYSRQEGEVSWTFSASYQRSFENGLLFNPGNEAILAAGFGYNFSPRVSASVQAKLNRLSQSRYRDIGVPSTGATFVYMTPGIRWNVSSGASLYALVPLAIFEKVRDSQFVPQVALLAGVSKDF
jgi:hypothetical protein